MNISLNLWANVWMVGALSILRTILFLTRTFVLAQPARVIFCNCLLWEQKWPEDLFSFTMKVRFLIVIVTAHNFGRSWARSIQPNSNWSDREKWSTSKGGLVFSKLFRLDRTDPFSFGPKFPEILVEWIAPLVISSYVILPLYIFHYVSLFSS